MCYVDEEILSHTIEMMMYDQESIYAFVERDRSASGIKFKKNERISLGKILKVRIIFDYAVEKNLPSVVGKLNGPLDRMNYRAYINSVGQ